MESVKTWAFSVCCAAIVGGMMNILLPKSNLQKIYKTVFCVFFLCVILSPVLKIKTLNRNFFEFDSEYGDALYENEFTDNSEKYIESEIIKSSKIFLQDNGIDYKDISAKVNISDDGSININKFTLTFEKQVNSEFIGEALQQKIGVEPEILISGEN